MSEMKAKYWSYSVGQQAAIRKLTRPTITIHSASAQISRPSALKCPANRVNNVRKITYLLAMDVIILEDWSTITEGLTYVE